MRHAAQQSLSLTLTGSPSAPFATTTGRAPPGDRRQLAGRPESPAAAAGRPLARRARSGPPRTARPVDAQVLVEPERASRRAAAPRGAAAARRRVRPAVTGAHATCSEPLSVRLAELSCRTSVERERVPGGVADRRDQTRALERDDLPRVGRSALGPKLTLLPVIWTPPSSSGTPRRSTCRTPATPPRRVLSRPDGRRGRPSGPSTREAAARAGVEGRRGQRGPALTVTSFVTGTERAASSAVGRAGAARPAAERPPAAQKPITPERQRQPRAPPARRAATCASRRARGPRATTAATETEASRPNQPARASLPVPSAWTSATGHQA